MSKRLLNFVRLLFDTGTFSRPFLNYLLEAELPKLRNSKDKGWFYLIKAIVFEQNQDYISSEKNLVISEKYCNTSTLKYMILNRKLSLAMKRKQVIDAEEYYVVLRKKISSFPPLIRPTIVATLFSYCLRMKKDSFTTCAGKIKVDKMPNKIKSFILLNAGRESAENDNLSKSISEFKESYNLSKDNFHPAGMVFSLNASAWYIRKRHPKLSAHIGKKAVYTSSYYSELTKYFFAVDTLFTVLFAIEDPSAIDYSRVICAFKDFMPSIQKKNYNKVLDKAFTIEKLMIATQNSYKCTLKLEKFIMGYSKNISLVSSLTGIDRVTLTDIYKGRKQNIRGETLRKFIDGLKINVDIFNDPEPIVIEYLKLKKLETARSYMRILAKMELFQRKIEVFTIYSSIPGRNSKMPLLVRKRSVDKLFNLLNNLPELEKIMMKKPEWQYFLYIAYNLTAYEKARKDLAAKFIDLMPLKIRDIFYNEYFKSVDKERLVIDVFIRNYIRYKREWGVRLENIEYTRIAKKARLKTQPFLISLYYFKNKKDRQIILEFVQRIYSKAVSVIPNISLIDKTAR